MRVMTEQQIVQAQQLRDTGLTYEEIASRLGFHWHTVYRRLNPEYHRRQNKERNRRRKEGPKEIRNGTPFDQLVSQRSAGR